VIRDYVLSWYYNTSHLIQDTADILDSCSELLTTFKGFSKAEDEILRLMAHLCFQQFRRDIIESLSKELCSSLEGDVDSDRILFCYEGVRDAFLGSPNLVSGNKTAIKTPDMMIECLWGSTLQYNRKFFTDKPFRVMYRKTREILAGHAGAQQSWDLLFPKEFLQYHWILPFPDANGTLISTAKGTRAHNWWAVDQPKGNLNWVWARAKHRSGHPGQYPKTLQMNTESLAAHLKELVSRT